MARLEAIELTDPLLIDTDDCWEWLRDEVGRAIDCWLLKVIYDDWIGGVCPLAMHWLCFHAALLARRDDLSTYDSVLTI